MYKMLVVDDENLIRYCLTATFRDPLISVRTAATGSEAVLAILGDSFDLCILDLHLPDMSGIDIMRLIRTTTPETKICDADWAGPCGSNGQYAGTGICRGVAPDVIDVDTWSRKPGESR